MQRLILNEIYRIGAHLTITQHKNRARLYSVHSIKGVRTGFSVGACSIPVRIGNPVHLKLSMLQSRIESKMRFDCPP